LGAEASLPLREAIARWFARRNGAAATGERTVPMGWLDAPTAPPDSLLGQWRAGGIVPLLAMRCPVVARSGVAESVRALGVNALADVVRCGAADRP
jgi:hypothetical protein